MPSFLKKRDNVLVLVFAAVLVFYIGRLMQMQLIQGDEYESQIYKGTVRTQTVSAARGQITDRYGNPIVTNRVSMNIVLDRAFLPTETQNETILDLMALLERSGEEWIDELPISESAPYTFTGTDAEVAALKSFAGVNDYADADEVMHWLLDRFGLDNDPSSQSTAAAGGRAGGPGARGYHRAVRRGRRKRPPLRRLHRRAPIPPRSSANSPECSTRWSAGVSICPPPMSLPRTSPLPPPPSSPKGV